MRLEDKVVLMCGVGPGMGSATALLFAQEGARVMLNARRLEHVTETASRIVAAGGVASTLQGDVSTGPGAEAIVEQALDRYGRIDVLYCGAGGFFEPTREFSDVDESFWRDAVTNIMNSLYNPVRLVRPIMAEQGGGAIVTIAASFSVRQEGNPAYGAAKGGIIGLSQSLAKELYADNIRVNTIAAGLFRAKLAHGDVAPAATSLARTGHPEDIAYAALYLASDEAGWVTGQVLTVDGGVDVGTRPIWEHEK